MKKIEGVVVHYDDGSRERLSAQELMERFFRGFVQDPSQNPTGDSPAVVEPEKNIQTTQYQEANVGLPQEATTDITKPVGEESAPKVNTVKVVPSKKVDQKEYYAATMTRFPFGGSELRGKSLLECVMWDREFMEKVAKNTKGNNADLARKINLVLSRNPERELSDES